MAGDETYEVRSSHPASRDFRSLPAAQAARIRERIDGLAATPRPRGVKKLGDAVWRIRVGSYRVLFCVDDDERLVTILRIRHRRDVYRR